MVKKILGGLFLTMAVLVLVVSIATGAMFAVADYVPYYQTAAVLGSMAGTLIVVVLYAFSGVFLLMFDRGLKKKRTVGWKIRNRQCMWSLVLAIVYVVLLFGAGVVNAKSMFGFARHELPFSIPMMIFVGVWAMYALPFGASKKHFIKDADRLNYYLSDNETFTPCTKDATVLASEKALYFPKLFCVVPFDQIESVKPYQQLGEKGVYFNLTNGKKFSIATKHAESIQTAIYAHK